MYYFKYYLHIAAVENAEQAQKYRDVGWTEITCDEFIEAWRQRDKRAQEAPADGANASGDGAKKR